MIKLAISCQARTEGILGNQTPKFWSRQGRRSRKHQLDELEEIRNDAYDCANWYKDRMKRMHDRVIIRKEFHPGQKVLLYNSCFHLFPGKQKSRWTDPYMIHKVHPHGAIEVHSTTDGTTFQVNSHRLKLYHEYLSPEVKKIFWKILFIRIDLIHTRDPYMYYNFCIFSFN